MTASLADASMALLVVVMLALLCLGMSRSARLAGDSPSSAGARARNVALGASVWLALTAALGWSGVLAKWTSLPPRLPLLPLTAFASVVILNRTATLKRLVERAPVTWAIAAQTFRVGVELALYAYYAGGRAPVQITFEGRNFDILAGLTAPIVAWLVHRKRVSPMFLLLWNVFGLALLLNIVVVFLTSVPGRLHADWPGSPLTAPATWPFVWLPAFLAPLALFLHLVSLRQSVALFRSTAASQPRTPT